MENIIVHIVIKSTIYKQYLLRFLNDIKLGVLYINKTLLSLANYLLILMLKGNRKTSILLLKGLCSRLTKAR